MNVGIVGFGSIGTEVAKALLEGVENFYLYGISSRSKTTAEERISKLKKSIEIFDLETLINNCQIIAGIPMPGGEDNLKTGGVRSLNLSVACGIVSYSACLQLNLLNK